MLVIQFYPEKQIIHITPFELSHEDPDLFFIKQRIAMIKEQLDEHQIEIILVKEDFDFNQQDLPYDPDELNIFLSANHFNSMADFLKKIDFTDKNDHVYLFSEHVEKKLKLFFMQEGIKRALEDIRLILKIYECYPMVNPQSSILYTQLSELDYRAENELDYDEPEKFSYFYQEIMALSESIDCKTMVHLHRKLSMCIHSKDEALKNINHDFLKISEINDEFRARIVNLNHRVFQSLQDKELLLKELDRNRKKIAQLEKLHFIQKPKVDRVFPNLIKEDDRLKENMNEPEIKVDHKNKEIDQDLNFYFMMHCFSRPTALKVYGSILAIAALVLTGLVSLGILPAAVSFSAIAATVSSLGFFYFSGKTENSQYPDALNEVPQFL